jgi:hypothetical protein
MLVMPESTDRSLRRHLHAEQVDAGSMFEPGERLVECVSRAKTRDGALYLKRLEE